MTTAWQRFWRRFFDLCERCGGPLDYSDISMGRLVCMRFCILDDYRKSYGGPTDDPR